MTVAYDKLLAPFPAEQIGRLPRLICRDCSKSPNGSCNEHPKSRCAECGNYISPRHIHLDYVGHADVTRRLLEVDPTWTWEPMASDEHGLPVLDTDANGNPVGMWIRLTVGGVTRYGYGSCPSNQSDAIKVLIGDALRNAAMRFGVAVDLWAKGDRTDPTVENATSNAGQAQRRRPDSEIVELKRQVVQVRKEGGWGADPTTIPQHFTEVTGMDADAMQTRPGLEAYLRALREDIAKRADTPAAS